MSLFSYELLVTGMYTSKPDLLLIYLKFGV